MFGDPPDIEQSLDGRGNNTQTVYHASPTLIAFTIIACTVAAYALSGMRSLEREAKIREDGWQRSFEDLNTNLQRVEHLNEHNVTEYRVMLNHQMEADQQIKTLQEKLNAKRRR